MYVDVWQTLEHLCRTPNTSAWSRASARMTYSIRLGRFTKLLREVKVLWRSRELSAGMCEGFLLLVLARLFVLWVYIVGAVVQLWMTGHLCHLGVNFSPVNLNTPEPCRKVVRSAIPLGVPSSSGRVIAQFSCCRLSWWFACTSGKRKSLCSLHLVYIVFTPLKIYPVDRYEDGRH